MKKKLLFWTVCVILCFSSVTISFATEDSTKETINENTTTNETISNSDIQTLETNTTPKVKENSINNQALDMTNISNMLSLKTEKINVPFESSIINEDVNPISYKTTVNVNGNKCMIYPTFDSRLTAINNIQEQCSLIIEEMQNEYDLDKFSTLSWETYYNKIFEYENIIFEKSNTATMLDEDQASSEQLSKLKGFFDIYENYDTNELILSEISKINQSDFDVNTNSTASIISKMSQIANLSFIMPSNTNWDSSWSDLISQIDRMINYSTLTSEVMSHPNNGKFSVTKGVKYADKYAKTPNKSKYGYKSSDCTNFVSQIKHEGNVPYYLTGNVSKGWSHWLEYHAQVAQHAYSTKWVRADSFTKFFGIKQTFKTKSYSNRRTAFIKFAAAVKKGSFIAYDEEGDGDWNHNAFVSHVYHSGENSRRNVPYHGSTYKDFKIAQHSINYNFWVSNPKCKWEALPYEHSAVIFAIVN